ncbi:MAG TPA: cellulase family glycosylhydrolase [Thermoleophilia bacterium]|nr:cellulase family glycosylhydrolase [Thermoleophilia bacterium]
MTNGSSHHSSSGASRGRLRYFVGLSVAALCVAVGLWFVLFTALPGGTSAVQASTIKGVVDWRLEQNPKYPPVVDDATAAKIIAEMTSGVSGSGTQGLGARWTRVLVYWDQLQPSRPTAANPGWNTAYLARLKMIVTKFRAANVNVIITPADVPKWASDSSLWSSPPGHMTPGYQPFYAMKYTNPTVMAGFRNFARYLAQQLGGPKGATKFEVWNEPNISLSLYPQRRGHKYPDYGMRVYRAMLRAYYSGIKSVSRSYTVIAGATAPYGNNSTGATSPIVWAKNLKKNNMSRYFDAYSHHPYTVIGSRNVAPNQLPKDPAHMVNLANLSVLLNVFPSKPFYLTEFGYGAGGYNAGFGVQVSASLQAKYLTKAYQMAVSHRQVKALLWYMMQDLAPAPGRYGVYTGLMNAAGVPKPAWKAFIKVH